MMQNRDPCFQKLLILHYPCADRVANYKTCMNKIYEVLRTDVAFDTTTMNFNSYCKTYRVVL